MHLSCSSRNNIVPRLRIGRAFRRASGRIRVSDPSPTSVAPAGSSADKSKVEITRRTTVYDKDGDQSGFVPEGTQKVNPDNVLEERDAQFDAMLSQMVGRIRSKPGGKPEMGEAAVVERYNEPMPKLRSTKCDTRRYEERPVPPGTLNVAQLRHILLLHQGKAEDHHGPMDVHQIAEKFRLEVAQVQRVLRFVSLPPEDNNKQKNNP